MKIKRDASLQIEQIRVRSVLTLDLMAYNKNGQKRLTLRMRNNQAPTSLIPATLIMYP
jgi:hypothetical protein